MNRRYSRATSSFFKDIQGKCLFSFPTTFESDQCVELEDIQTRNLTMFDPESRQLKTPKKIGYYREPDLNEYPLDLANNYEKVIHFYMDKDAYRQHKNCHYIMTTKMKPTFDFCTTRGLLVDINWNNKADLIAIKFKNCIYLKSHYPDDETQTTPRMQYAYKLRQYLFVDQIGDKPNTDEILDIRRQVYANCSATLGKFKLLYSAEVTGVNNTEPLTDLEDPRVLSQLRFSMARVLDKKFQTYDWRANLWAEQYLFQAYLIGIENMRLAYFNRYGIVVDPVITYSFASLLQFQDYERKLKLRLQLIHKFLEEISNLMAKEDCPYTSYAISIRNNCVRYDRYEGRNKFSFLDTDYIEFINNLYQSN